MTIRSKAIQTGARSRFFFLSTLIVFSFCGCGPSRNALLADADAHLKAGDLDAARQDYRRILGRHPFDVDALQGMVTITRKGDNVSEHLDYCRRLLQLRTWDRYANLVVGKDLLERGNLKDAAVRFYMAYLDSDFVQEKNEVLALLEQTRIKEQQRIQSLQENQNEPSKRTDLPG